VWVAALIITYTFFFWLTLPAFKYGDASDVLHLFWAYDPLTFPYHKLPAAVKTSLYVAAPMILLVSGTAIVLLGKINPLEVLIPSVIAGTAAFVLQKFLWRSALRGYTSASS
jgi:ABC-type uncharacterized transport system permease subunit